jgi:hypothetical protein
VRARRATDPYINVDAGTMSPFEHGEVFVLDDGGEARPQRGACGAQAAHAPRALQRASDGGGAARPHGCSVGARAPRPRPPMVSPPLLGTDAAAAARCFRRPTLIWATTSALWTSR